MASPDARTPDQAQPDSTAFFGGLFIQVRTPIDLELKSGMLAQSNR
jgi:hypothetical protein